MCMKAVISSEETRYGKEYKIVDGPVTLRTLKALVDLLKDNASDDAVLYTGRKNQYGFGAEELLTADYENPVTVNVDTYNDNHQTITFYKHLPDVNPYVQDEDEDDDDDDDYDESDISSDYDESVDRDYGVQGALYMSGNDIEGIMDEVDNAICGENLDYQLDVINTVIDRLVTIKADLMTKTGAIQQNENRDVKIEAGESM